MSTIANNSLEPGYKKRTITSKVQKRSDISVHKNKGMRVRNVQVSLPRDPVDGAYCL